MPPATSLTAVSPWRAVQQLAGCVPTGTLLKEVGRQR
jgi:hypothetical protein